MSSLSQRSKLEDIRSALSEGSQEAIEPASRRLLNCLGYRSDRTLPGQSGNLGELLDRSQAGVLETNSKRYLVSQVRSLYFLFQMTDEEIKNQARTSLLDFADGGRFDEGIVRSFLFVGIELKEQTYARSRYAELAREVNKHIAMPSFVIFRTASGQMTLAFVHRRKHQRDSTRQVLGRVQLIREIKPENPHRAHLDSLRELSLAERLVWMDSHRKSKNFDGLLAAILDTLDTQALNKRFYEDLFSWFERAVETAKFPVDQPETLSKEEHVIRLITRVLFIWFIKEKGLVADELFVEDQARLLLQDYDAHCGDSYYRAILQNLFFATLNCEFSQRGWSSKENATHRVFSRWRFHDEVRQPERLAELFARTPFINGGLFDCLDSIESKSAGGYRIDGFSDNVTKPTAREYRIVSVPDSLFFDDSGLFTIFNRYKFTVEENTPTEIEVALDPELLGRVFENLLAAYNPETRETARKQSGSYYTPRPVVDYMVGEALAESLVVNTVEATNIREWRERLECLLDYDDAFNDAHELFSEKEIGRLIHAISTLRVLDPACGSGAFPMGVLHRLTLALRRLDFDNHGWEALQKEIASQKAIRAFDTASEKERNTELAQISSLFESYRDSDFGRKLYLLQNSIFGVDIQPVACQIAKLRFFISLVIEQELRPDDDNLGIRPLPNLETKFIAADALLGLQDTSKLQISTIRSEEIKTDLRANREMHFHAQTRQQKLRSIERDADLRETLATELQDSGFAEKESRRIADWDPFNQMAVADWFDPKYMFGLDSGFDLILANPPYVESRNNLISDEQKNAYLHQVEMDWSATIPRGSDLLIYFFCRGAKFMSKSGLCAYITQNSWLSTDYGYKFQQFSEGRFSFHRILDTESKFFTDIGSQNINAVITFQGYEPRSEITYEILDVNFARKSTKTISSAAHSKWGHQIAMPKDFQAVMDKIPEHSHPVPSITWGQGLNVSKSIVTAGSGSVPVVLNTAAFVCKDSDGEADVRLPKTRKVPALFMPRGIGDRQWCSFNIGKCYTYSHVEIYLPDEWWFSDAHYCLWAYMNSSLVWLYREITGRRNLGGGLLKSEVSDMKRLPVGIRSDFAAEVKSVMKSLRRDPLAIQDEVTSDEHQRIDELVFDRLGIGNAKDDVQTMLLEVADFRLRRSRSV